VARVASLHPTLLLLTRFAHVSFFYTIITKRSLICRESTNTLNGFFPGNCTVVAGTDFFQSSGETVVFTGSSSDCCAACWANVTCHGWTFDGSACWLKPRVQVRAHSNSTFVLVATVYCFVEGAQEERCTYIRIRFSWISRCAIFCHSGLWRYSVRMTTIYRMPPPFPGRIEGS